MSDEKMEMLEGKIAAQRALLVAILTALLGSGHMSAAALEDELVVRDGEEDPGVIPSRAFAMQEAKVREMKSVVEQALARHSALGRG